MTSAPDTMERAKAADDFKTMLADNLPADVLDKAAAHLEGTTTGYAANGSIASVVIWMKCQCTINNNGKTFDGSSWGISFPGGGALIGTVYTDDLAALYANTETFALAATSVYTSFVFFDKNHSPLGSFQAGSISTVNGTGGGKGHWS